MTVGKFEVGDIVTLNTEKLTSFSKEWEYNIDHYLPLWNEEGIVAEVNSNYFRIFFPAHPSPDYPVRLGDGIYWNINPVYLKGKSKS